MEYDKIKFDEDVYKEVVKLFKLEREKTYWRMVKSIKKKNKNQYRNKKLSKVMK